MWIAVALAVTFLALPSLTVAQELAGISSFMMPPRTTWATTQPSASNAVVVEEVNQSGVGFRIIRLRASVKGKKQAAIDLARSKLIEPGDILLSFRPLWDKTLAYAHMQLGVSHSAVAFLVSEGGEQFVMTLESPISYSSPLNAPEHYSDLDAIHVIRPTLSEAHKRNLEKWARLVLLNKSRFRFFSDYSLPMYKRGLGGVTSAKDQVRLLADILIGSNTDSRFESYCSEFVWTLMGLRNCDPAAFDSTCIKPLFSTSGGMMTGIIPGLNGDSGLIQGPDFGIDLWRGQPCIKSKGPH